MKLSVNLGSCSYPIYIEHGILDRAGSYITQVFSGKKIMILSDDHVFPLYGERLETSLSDFEVCHLVLPHGETTKAFQTLPGVYSTMLEHKLTRSDLIIALGGGVIGDLAGFAASTYLRGIQLVQIPTSLLAQVDSSVGGKVAVDLPQGKNLVGSFHHPRLVLIDPDVLATLPEHFIHDGMGEVIKYGCIRNAELFRILEERNSFSSLSDILDEILFCCVDIKRQIVEHDQFDTGERMLLNFGHTLAHTIEQYFQYKRESHGEAVAIGMYQITKVAEAHGLCLKGTAERIGSVLASYSLPHSCSLPVAELLEAMSLDKKNLNGRLNLVLLHEIGDSYIYPATPDFFRDAGMI